MAKKRSPKHSAQTPDEKLKRHLKKRASDSSISTAFDTHFPALATLLEPFTLCALAATSKEHLERLASRPVMGALALPILSSPAVLQRINAAPRPAQELFRIIAADAKPQANKSPEYNFECIVDVRLKNGTRIVERGHHYDEVGDEDPWACVINFDFSRASKTIVIESEHEFVSDHFPHPMISHEWRGRKEFRDFREQTLNVGEAQVTLVREDGKFLRIFSGSIAALCSGDWEIDDDDYNYHFPYKIPMHDDVSYVDECQLSATDYQLHSKAAIWTANKKEGGNVRYYSQGLELRLKCYADHRGSEAANRYIDSKTQLLGLLNYTGSWQ